MLFVKMKKICNIVSCNYLDKCINLTFSKIVYDYSIICNLLIYRSRNELAQLIGTLENQIQNNDVKEESESEPGEFTVLLHNRHHLIT